VCDPIWQVTPRSCETGFPVNQLYTLLTFLKPLLAEMGYLIFVLVLGCDVLVPIKNFFNC